MPERTNILLITADDLNCNSVGAYGCKTPDITPNIDRLAAEGMRFTHAHVTIAVCQPSRGVLATGLYPHRNGMEGFHHTDLDVPTIMETLRDAGFATGILGKLGHCTPKTDYEWDMQYDMPELGFGRDPELYYRYAKRFIEQARDAGRPFYLMANSHDPHRPFVGSDQEKNAWGDRDITPPSRVYHGDDVEMPGFLPDLPEVRREMGEYFSSVRRCDDTVGAVLRALREAGQEDNTLVMFLSDNGMALPFAKTNCYLHSTRTPWIARWPRKIAPSTVDDTHFISGVDFFPTVLDVLRLPSLPVCDGRTFLSVLLGQAQEGRDRVFTQFHETAGVRRYPMRCVQDRRFGFIFNPWSDGERIFLNESQSGRTFAAMTAAAEHDAEIAARVELFRKRVPEELYDFANDPDALRNLIDDPAHADEVARLRGELLAWMEKYDDPARECLGEGSGKYARFMQAQEAKAEARKAARQRRG